jgi:hypothetical protein
MIGQPASCLGSNPVKSRFRQDSSSSTKTSTTRTGLFSSIQSSRHSGNRVLCPRSVPSTKRFIRPSAAAKNQRCENHMKRGVFTTRSITSFWIEAIRPGTSAAPRKRPFHYTAAKRRFGGVEDERGSLGHSATLRFPSPAHRTGRVRLRLRHPALRLLIVRHTESTPPARHGN